MKSIVAVSVIVTCSLMGSAASTAERQAQCKFVFEGKTIINGRCNFESDPDGSFRLWDRKHTVYLNADGNSAEATWNKIPGSFHADSPVGTLTRKGACWVNEKTEICARSLQSQKYK